MSDRLRRLVSNVSGLAQADVVPDANWFALGLDSLLVLQLQLALNKAFGLDVKLSDIFERGTTLRDLTTLVIDHLDALPAVASRAPVERPPTRTVSQVLRSSVRASFTLWYQSAQVFDAASSGVEQWPASVGQ